MKPKLIYQVFTSEIGEDGNKFFLWKNCRKQKYSKTPDHDRRIVTKNSVGSYYIVDENGKVKHYT